MGIQQEQPPVSSHQLSTQPRTATADLFGDPIDSHPLWFKQSSFLSPDFDSESYISDLRTFVPFETLRSELQSHLSSLKHELVELINRDYADFVNLSTKLVDVDAAVLRMRAPLIEIREKILGFRGAVEGSLVSLQGGLRQRAEASAAREILELLIDTSHVVSKVEKLIKELHNVPADASNGDLHTAEKGHLSNGVSLQHAEIGINLRETQSMLLERIASEMNRLKFYFAHAKNLPFIENMEKRIQNASLLLDTSLGHCFVDGLIHKDENAVYNCLRAYASVDNTHNAEEIFRSTVVAPLVQKVIPYTSSGMVGGSTGDELEEDYKQIKNLIAQDCTFLLEISSTENSGLHVFSFLANSILKEVLWAIQQGKPGAFSPGRPTEFLKNYKSSLGFLADLEGYCPSRSAVANFRAEAVYVDFLKQWNIGVYFSLRFQEIAGSLDSAFVGSNLTPIPKSDSDSDSSQGSSQHVTLKQSLTLLECLNSCWREDVLVLSISDKFLRLTLQLISRYANWLSAGLSARRTRNSGFEWALTAAPDDFVYIIHDLDHLATEVCGKYIEHVLKILNSCSTQVVDTVKNSILQGGQSLKDLVPSVIDSIIETLVEKSNEELKQLHGIVAAYRMTKKPPPVRHSHYVSGVLRPLKVFVEGERAMTYLREDRRGKLIEGAAVKITGRYNDLAADIVNTARKTETSLQRIRKGAQRRAGATSDVSDHNVSETDRICMQLFLDIQEYGRNLAGLGVEAAKIPAGIMPINNYNGFIRMTGFCKTKIPSEITAALEPIKDNEEAVRNYGVHLGTEMCKKIMASGIKTLHLYTLNNEKSALAILTSLGLVDEAKITRPLPWRRPTNLFRLKEDVRPIFWANRPKSYISRTGGWEQYPHGRWADSSNASYGALTDHQFMRPRARDKKIQAEWVVPLTKFDDISEKFMKYCLGQLKTSPWSDLDALQPETKIINEELASINLKGFLTINSQPAVNGAKSDSPSVGWGPAGGYVYQKAYVEFFCSGEKLNALVEKSKAIPSLTYLAVNKEGTLVSNVGKNDVNAVTWGAFPGKEIIQPTVVDPASFLIWKDEAFEIWSRGWAQLYPQEDNTSRSLLQEVQNTYYLVSLVDNDYINTNLFTVFKGF